MPDFHYQAKRSTGEAIAGTIAAASQQEAIRELVAKSLVPLQIKSAAAPARSGRTVPARHVAAMYAQLADLLQAGIPLLRCLEVLQQQKPHAGLSAVLNDVRERVADGATLADALARHPRVFRELAVSIVRAGEEGGFLEDALKRIAVFTDQQEDLRGRVVGALAYPVFLVVVGTVVLTSLLVFFVPRFRPIFERLEQQGELPLPTTLLLAVSDLARDHGVWVLLGGLVAALAGRRFLTSPLGRRMLDGWRLRSLVIGPIVRSLAIARFCRVLGTLLRNGVAILPSLRIAKDATGNFFLAAAIGRAAESITAGRSLAPPLAASGQFPPEIIEVVAVGEQANKLEQVLLDAADSLERRTYRRLDMLVRLLEPTMLLLMAVVILFLVLALLLPVFQSASALS